MTTTIVNFFEFHQRPTIVDPTPVYNNWMEVLTNYHNPYRNIGAGMVKYCLYLYDVSNGWYHHMLIFTLCALSLWLQLCLIGMNLILLWLRWIITKLQLQFESKLQSYNYNWIQHLVGQPLGLEFNLNQIELDLIFNFVKIQTISTISIQFNWIWLLQS